MHITPCSTLQSCGVVDFITNSLLLTHCCLGTITIVLPLLGSCWCLLATNLTSLTGRSTIVWMTSSHLACLGRRSDSVCLSSTSASTCLHLLAFGGGGNQGLSSPSPFIPSANSHHISDFLPPPTIYVFCKTLACH